MQLMPHSDEVFSRLTFALDGPSQYRARVTMLSVDNQTRLRLKPRSLFGHTKLEPVRIAAAHMPPSEVKALAVSEERATRGLASCQALLQSSKH